MFFIYLSLLRHCYTSTSLLLAVSGTSLILAMSCTGLLLAVSGTSLILAMSCTGLLLAVSGTSVHFGKQSLNIF